MGLRIATNVQSLSAQRFLSNNTANLNKSLEKLSSGSRINRAGDDAAGLAISERLKANIRSLHQASRNANDGVSMVQVAEGAMNEVSNILIRMRELSIQASSDTIGDTERGFIQKEVAGLKDEVQRIAQSTEYNGTKLLDGHAGPVGPDGKPSGPAKLEIQIGINNNQFEDRFIYDTAQTQTTLEGLGLHDIAVDNKQNAQMNLASLDTAISKLNGNRAALGALQNRLASTINNLGIYTENLSTANSRIRDTDMAQETSELTKNNILSQANISVLSQANSNSQMALKLLG